MNEYHHHSGPLSRFIPTPTTLVISLPFDDADVTLHWIRNVICRSLGADSFEEMTEPGSNFRHRYYRNE